MPFEYLEDEALADIGIRVTASTVDSLFVDAGLSVCHLMTDVTALASTEVRVVDLVASDLELLLHSFLEEFVYLKDAELFLVKSINCVVNTATNSLSAQFHGTYFDRSLHTIGNDVKAITLHDFYIRHESHWVAHFIVDI